MFVLETLNAVLQGMPFEHLAYHPSPQWLLYTYINREIHAGSSPAQAFKDVVEQAPPGLKNRLDKFFVAAYTVSQLRDLSFRQQELLIALRLVSHASVPELSLFLQQDRSNIHKRAATLVRKGYAIKFLQPNGVCYMVPTALCRATSAKPYTVSSLS